MKELPYVVECNWGNYWEPIAAFDSRGPAEWYRDQCKRANEFLRYRVTVKEHAS